MRISDWSSDVCSSDLPVVAVVADDEAAALDAVEAISVDYDDLPVVLDLEAAVSGGAPPLWEQAPGNVGIDWHKGNPAETERAFAEAARSEEHTSELQSLMRISYAVFCLKKTKQIIETPTLPYKI